MCVHAILHYWPVLSFKGGFMQIYNYDQRGFYTSTHTLDDSDRDPLNPDEYLIPANSTTIAPPALDEHQSAVWDGGQWIVMADYRGTHYWFNNVESVMQVLGDLPINAVLEKPQSVIDAEFADYKAKKRDEINSIRDARIYIGVEFPPDSGVIFDSDELAQKNINGAVAMSMLATLANQPFEQQWITKNNTVVTLDAAGVAGLGVTLGKHIGKHLLVANAYKTQLNDAIDKAVVDSIVEAYAAL